MNLHDQKPSLEEALEHYGVKGMKWGVRRSDEELALARKARKVKTNKNTGRRSDEDLVLKKGTKVYNISAGKKRDLSSYVYGAYHPEDVVNYRGTYANSLRFKTDKVFNNTFEVKQDIRAPSDIAARKEFKNFWDENPERMAVALAEAQVGMKLSAKLNNKVLKMDRTSVYEQRLMNRGSKWVTGRGYDEFVRSMGLTENKARQPFMDHLSEKGYNALVDLNDTKNYRSIDPILVFKGKDVFGKQQSVELKKPDIQAAVRAYQSREKFEKYAKSEGLIDPNRSYWDEKERR